MPQELLTAVALIVPGAAAGLLYSVRKFPASKGWVYCGYAFAFFVLDIAFVMGMLLLIRGKEYQLDAFINQTKTYLMVLLLSLAGAIILYIAAWLKDLVVVLLKDLSAVIFKGKKTDG